MKMTSIMAFCLGIFLFACSASKKTNSTMTDVSKLEGTWELNYITGPRIAFDGLYPTKKPTISFDVANKRVGGNTSCNNFNGVLKADDKTISFTDPMAVTKMMCMDGKGETVFLETLKKVNSYSITDGNTLTFLMGDVAMMRFNKK